MSTQRSRGFCFTVNNYVLPTIAAIKRIAGYKYVIMGKEVGESGTPHLQGYIHFDKPKTLRQIRQLIQGHIEVRRGTVDQAIEYCKKDGVYEEVGERPVSSGESTQILWKEILARSKAGDYQWIEDNYPKIWIQLSTNLQSLRTREIKILDTLDHEWWVGPTGTGKSRLVWDLYPTHYQKELNKWWCGYQDEQVVVVEEWSPKNECTGSQLKIWADRYPFTGQIKGGSLKSIRPTKIIVLSNYTIDQCFTDERDSLPLHRRFRTVRFPLESAEELSMRSTLAAAQAEAADALALVQAQVVVPDTSSSSSTTILTSTSSSDSPLPNYPDSFWTDDYEIRPYDSVEQWLSADGRMDSLVGCLGL